MHFHLHCAKDYWLESGNFCRLNRTLFCNFQAANTVEVTECSKKESSKPRPQALNTVELMRVASAGLGMSPQHCMQCAEHLYTQGYISYPRTETTQYPENFDLQGALRLQQVDVRHVLYYNCLAWVTAAHAFWANWKIFEKRYYSAFESWI